MTETLIIENGVIENINYESHKRGKNWVAIVAKNRSKPGGLERNFLDRVRGPYVRPNGITAGTFLEFAGDYYSCGGHRSEKRKYYKVLDVSETEIRMDSCEFDEIGKNGIPPNINPLEGYSDDEILTEAKRRNLI